MNDRGTSPDGDVFAGGSRPPVMIELGVLSHGDPYDSDDPGSKPRPSPWLAVLLVLACCAVGLAGAGEPPARPSLTFSATGVLEPPQLTGDSVLAYVDDPAGAVVASYGIDDGTLRWQHRPERRVAVIRAEPVVMFSPTACRSIDTFTTEAFDVRTGDPRWRQPGMPVWTVPDGSVVVFKQPVRSCSEATVGFDPLPTAPFRWAGVDTATGTVRWSVDVPAGATLTAGADKTGRASWFAVSDNGTITAFNLTTGVIAGQLAAPAGVTSPAALRILGAGDALLLVRRERGLLTVVAHDVPSLVERWTAQLLSPRGITRLELNSFTARWCGPVICLGPPTETVGLEPGTGVERWRMPGRPIRIGSGRAVFVRTPPVPGWPVFTVHDLRTGLADRQLPESNLLGRLDDGALIGTPGDGGGRLWRLDLATGAMRAMTTLPRQYVECAAAGRHLACRGGDGALQVWRLPERCPASCAPVPLAAAATRKAARG